MTSLSTRGAGGAHAAPAHLAPPSSLRRLALLGAALTAARIIVGVVTEKLAFRIVPHSVIPLDRPAGAQYGFFNWDAGFYQLIWHYGYPASQPRFPSFYPLYPMTVRLVTTVLPVSYHAGALAVSYGSLCLATIALLRLSVRLMPQVAPWRPAVVLLWFPTSVFLISGYAEPMLIALVAGAALALAEERPLLAAALGALASCCRPEGVFVGLAILVWELGRRSRPLLRSLALVVLSEGGFLLYSGFLWKRYGSPFAELKAQHYWQRTLTWPLHPVFGSVSSIIHNSPQFEQSDRWNQLSVVVLDDVLIVAAIAVAVVFIRMFRGDRRQWWLIALAVAPLVLVTINGSDSGTSSEAAGRLLLCAPVLYLAAARLRGELAWGLALAGLGISAIACQLLFNLGGWFT